MLLYHTDKVTPCSAMLLLQFGLQSNNDAIHIILIDVLILQLSCNCWLQLLATSGVGAEQIFIAAAALAN